ncbi:MAG: TraR/DksA family transcriptional regulator [Bacteroidetes bacterium]|nr:MAG: TraR/DksA family transcriptional regulator [Bacteroidota bacterium]REK05785.1 MAG: TraR/DksA family transcriptional regulator [Bacteroidota bacterium]REK31910.1 MAG: TraR/DksA family transcriptional regulator [Bacteroidota bacterium]REK49975.1 MAG: TraR/DksA family transcriptional regulator [Bacteroidota bacterium]
MSKKKVVKKAKKAQKAKPKASKAKTKTKAKAKKAAKPASKAKSKPSASKTKKAEKPAVKKAPKKETKPAAKKAAPAKAKTPVAKAPEPKKIQETIKAPVKNLPPVEKKPAKAAAFTKVTRHNIPFHKHEQARQIIPKTKEEPGKTKYSDAELEEFREIIVKKLDDARKELATLQAQLNSSNEHGTDDTASTFKMLEDGSDSLAKEEAGQLASRQKKFIEQLENALIRIENKTYGVCRVTGKLIPKERLRAVPHTTQSIEAKLNQYRD